MLAHVSRPLHLEVHNVWTLVVRPTEEQEEWLASLLCVPEKRGKEVVQAPLLRRWTSPHHTLPSGLVPVIEHEARRANVELEVVDLRTPPVPLYPARLAWLEDFQCEGVERALVGVRGVLRLPTGSGKTEIIAGVVGMLRRARILITVHRSSVVQEIVERLRLRHPSLRVGQVSDGVVDVQRVTVASFQGLEACFTSGNEQVKAFVRNAQALIVDEGQSLGASTYYHMAMETAGAYWRLVFSATPFSRSDGKGLMVVAASGPELYRVTTPELVKEEAIAEATVHMIAHPVEWSVGVSAASYADLYRACVSENHARNTTIVRLLRRVTYPAVVFVREVDHGKVLVSMLERAGVNAEMVWGAKNVHKRKAAIERLEHGDIDVIVANVVFQEGVNIPTLATVVHAGGGKAEIMTLQQAGRGARRRDSTGRTVKERFDIYDLADAHCGCMIEDEGHRLYRHRACRIFNDHTRARTDSYKSEGLKVLV